MLKVRKLRSLIRRAAHRSTSNIVMLATVLPLKCGASILIVRKRRSSDAGFRFKPAKSSHRLAKPPINSTGWPELHSAKGSPLAAADDKRSTFPRNSLNFRSASFRSEVFSDRRICLPLWRKIRQMNYNP